MMSKVEVLFFTADPRSGSPGGSDPLQLGREMREIRDKVGTARHRRALTFDWNPAARSDDLLQALLDKRPQIVHFSGHGDSAGLELWSPDGTQPMHVGTPTLRELFKMLSGDIRVVVLSACFSEPQAKAIAEVIGCAIGTRGPIPDDAAITFNAAFYRAIASGYSVQAAYNEARTALALGHSEDCACPELLVRPGLDASKLILVSRFPAVTRMAAVAGVIAGVALGYPEPTPPAQPAWRGVQLGDCSWTETASAAPSAAPGDALGASADLAQAKAFCHAGHYDEAFPLFKRAAEARIPEAMGFLGIAYQSGEGTVADPQLAAFWLKEAAYADDPRGMIAWGMAFRGGEKQGYAVRQSDRWAAHWFEKAAVTAGSLEAMLNLGRLYLEDRKDSLALVWFQKAVDAGSAEGMVEIGLMHEHGRAVRRNPAEALRLYEMAADSGSPRGYFEAGKVHQNGRNYREARVWYLRGACEGSVEAMYQLGMLHLNGLGVRRDRGEAIVWFRRAADAGSTVAEKKLAKLDAGRENRITKVLAWVNPPDFPAGCERSHAVAGAAWRAELPLTPRVDPISDERGRG
jgi:TPR repeat protein